MACRRVRAGLGRHWLPLAAEVLAQRVSEGEIGSEVEIAPWLPSVPGGGSELVGIIYLIIKLLIVPS